MKIYDLIDRLQEFSSEDFFQEDAEILVEDETGALRDFVLTGTEAVFDGFDEFAPEGLKITLKN